MLQFKSTKLNFILLPQLLCAIRKALVVHISAKLLMAQRTQNTLVNSIRVSQGNVATRFGCGEIFNDSFVANVLKSLVVKEFRKSVDK